MTLTIVCPWVDHLPSRSSLLGWGGLEGWASWALTVISPSQSPAPISSWHLLASARPEATAQYCEEAPAAVAAQQASGATSSGVGQAWAGRADPSRVQMELAPPGASLSGNFPDAV